MGAHAWGRMARPTRCPRPHARTRLVDRFVVALHRHEQALVGPEAGVEQLGLEDGHQRLDQLARRAGLDGLVQHDLPQHIFGSHREVQAGCRRPYLLPGAGARAFFLPCMVRPHALPPAPSAAAQVLRTAGLIKKGMRESIPASYLRCAGSGGGGREATGGTGGCVKGGGRIIGHEGPIPASHLRWVGAQSGGR
jgi:hypothetical protein